MQVSVEEDEGVKDGMHHILRLVPVTAVAFAPSKPPTLNAATTASSRSLESGKRNDMDAASLAFTTKKASTMGRNRAKSAAIAQEAPALLPSITVPSASSS